MSNMEESSDWQSGEEEEEEEEGGGEEEENSINQEQETEEEEELADYGSEDKYSPTGDDEPLCKRTKVVVDRISKLPDSVNSHILSMMPTRDAIRTCILSKRWRHTWASTSALIYILEKESPKRFAKFVDKTLILHKSSKIEKFILKSFNEKLLKSSVSLWVQAVVIKQVEELSIEFSFDDYGIYQALPRSLYSCDSLIKLNLNGCSVAPVYSPVCWRSLKHLTLTDMELEDDVLQKFLTGSPLLEYLKLDDCQLLKHIRIDSRKVRTLVIKNDVSQFEDAREHACLEISAPHLESLKISGSMPNLKCKLDNVRSLVHASLTFHMSCWEDCYNEHNDYQRERDDRLKMARELMKKVGHVRNLTLGSWMVQECKFEEPKDFDGKNYWAAKDMEFKSLRIVGFVGFSKYVIELAEFLLRNGKTLEEMIFREESNKKWIFRKEKCSDKKRQDYFGNGDFFGTMQKLLNLPRSSPRAKIVLV